MNYLFALVWQVAEYSCPWGLSLAPAQTKALICTKKEETKWHLDETLRGALDKAEELGPGVPMVLINLQTGKREKIKWEAHGD